jgi:hypothetical protein
MNRIALAGLAIQLCAAPAFAQTTAPAPSTSMPPSSQTARPDTNMAAQSSAGTTVMPQSAQANSMAPAGGAPGANSFTESQARGRLAKEGYSQVSGLTKGNDGVWRGTATKNGNAVQVGVDYKGNISMN